MDCIRERRFILPLRSTLEVAFSQRRENKNRCVNLQEQNRDINRHCFRHSVCDSIGVRLSVHLIWSIYFRNRGDFRWFWLLRRLAGIRLRGWLYKHLDVFEMIQDELKDTGYKMHLGITDVQ